MKKLNFLNIPGIKGESGNAEYANQVEVRDFEFGASQTGSFAANIGGGTGTVQVQDFSFTKFVDCASPLIFKAVATGQHFDKITLSCTKAGNKQQTFMIVTFSNAMFSDYQIGGAGNSEEPAIERIRLSFSKIEFKYCKQKNDGTLAGAIVASYDMQKQLAA